MQIDTNRGGQLRNVPTRRPAPCYNLISVGAQILGIFAFLFLGIVRPWDHYETAMIWILGGSWFVGFVLAIIALVRLERLWGLTAFGLILNGFLFLVFLACLGLFNPVRS